MNNKTDKLLNTMLNPLASDTIKPDWFRPFSSENANKTTAHAIALLATYGAMGYGARELFNMQNEVEDKKQQKKINDLVNTNDVYASPDNNLNDIEQEEALYTKGLTKKASDLLTPDLTMALPIAATILGGYSGYKIADRLKDRKEKKELEEEIKDAKNKLDKLYYEKLNDLRRPQEKTASVLPRFTEDSYNIRTSFDNVKAAATLALLGTMAGSFYLADDYFKNDSAAKKRFNAILDEAERHSLKKGAPTLHINIDRDLKNKLNNKKEKETPDNTSMSLSQAVDDKYDDTVANLLAN